ncbi:metallophosphoesterase 1-like [Cynara cardunculus var. scolymus]|uniref:metallophosphoesterase 1-like n=1 Tax=Cynara cardunculus var. scolymus TaxID=59895 RepID=UPI000D627B1D|nr:metallophosphoesterase 1-like [Cynara cardunculus var. scolymus]
MVQKRLLLFLVTILHIFYENWVPTPSCDVVPGVSNQEIHQGKVEDDLKVMMVADLLLSGHESRSGYLDLHFKDFYFSRFFRKSFEFLKPDMLIVLGDVSAKGSELSRSKWASVLQEFHSLLGPFLDLPYHVVPGDRDIGECSQLNDISVNKITRSFPGLDSAGCGAFDIGNVNFFSLNSVALLCGDNDLRFSVEKALEREHIELQTGSGNDSAGIKIPQYDFSWRENAMSSGSGPVLLLHFPLHQIAENNWRSGSLQDKAEPSKRSQFRDGSYGLSQTLPPNATEYIFHALRPRMVFSAHTQTFSDHTHPDGIREIVVPAMSWDAGKKPAFVAVTFRRNGTSAIVSHCKLAGRSHVLLFYISLLFVLVLTVQTTLRS